MSRASSKARNNFKKGAVEMLVLAMLAEEGELYGYMISQMICHRSGNQIMVPEGSMYPTLYRLTDSGMITSRHELVGKRQSRVYYKIESKGLDWLCQLKKEYREVNEGIQRVLDWRENPESRL